MLSVFGRMTQSVLSILGEDALFNGVVRCKINIERGVQFTGMDGETAAFRGDLAVARDIATISNEALAQVPVPLPGKTFQLVGTGTFDAPAGETFRLDKYLDHNGYSARYILLKVA